MVDVDARLAEIAARAEKTTPGPWTIDPAWPNEVGAVDPISTESEWSQRVASVHDEDDAPFIAHAREDVPWLLAVLKEQAGQIERLQREATADAVARSGGGPGAFEARMRDALGRARRFHGALNMAIDDGDDYGEHVGMQRHRRAVSDGQCEILRIWEEALEPLPEPPPLPPRIYGEARPG